MQEDRAYKKLADEYQKRQIHSQEVRLDTELYAMEVVKKVFEAEGWLWKTKIIWAAGGAGTIRWSFR